MIAADRDGHGSRREDLPDRGLGTHEMRAALVNVVGDVAHIDGFDRLTVVYRPAHIVIVSLE